MLPFLAHYCIASDSKAVIDNNGVVYYEKIGTPWPGGQPFPWAKTGLEAMGNYQYGRVWDSYRATPDYIWFVNASGEHYKTMGHEIRYIKCNGRILEPPLGTIPGFENILIKRISVLTDPLEIKGLGQFTVRYYDPAQQYDTGFAYLPAFKRTIRVNASTWQDNVGGTDTTNGDGDGFQEPIVNWDLKLIGKKFILLNEPKSPFPIFDEKGKLSQKLQFDVGKKYPRLGWVVRPVDVVEATPRFKHVYGKRVAYIPIWPYIYTLGQVVTTDLYDRQMRLWKGYMNFYGTHEYLNGDQDKPVTNMIGNCAWDLQTGHASPMWMRMKVNVGFKPDDVNLGKLLSIGR